MLLVILGQTLLYQFPQDKNLMRGGVMNEGIPSTELGLRGIPELAEITLVKRDIEILTRQ